MKKLKDFIRLIIKDLNLGKITPNMQKTIEFRLEKVIDKQIQNALEQTLTDQDWEVMKTYQTSHPEASNEEALNVIIESRPDLQDTLEGVLDSTYNQMMMMGDAVHLAMDEPPEKK